MEKNETSVNERVKLFCKVIGMSVTKLSGIINIPQTTLSGQLKEGGSVQFDTIISLLEKYPDLSAEWLLRGNGNMYIDNSTNINIDASGNHIEGDGNFVGNGAVETNAPVNNEELISLRVENKILKEQVDDLRKDKDNLTKMLLK